MINPIDTKGMKKKTRKVCRRRVFPPTRGEMMARRMMKNRLPTISRKTNV